MKIKSNFNTEILSSQTTNDKITKIVGEIVESYSNDDSLIHIHKYPLPSKEIIINILNDFFNILYPAYFTEKDLNKTNMNYYIGEKVSDILENLSLEIAKSFRHEHKIESVSCELCDKSLKTGVEITLSILEKIPELRELLKYDVQAAYEGDPAAKSFNEIIFSYPGLFAITVHRIAHILYENKVPLIPRIMSEYSHSITGIDIHPGATIGKYFFIDHGTGVVIGETCTIGNNVKIYQGVTLGALSFQKDNQGRLIKGLKRHPDIEDNVTIYSGATILGGETVIGHNSTIGGNVWIVASVPPNSKVMLADNDNKIIISNSNKK